jgi:hypothetical protein
LTRIWLSLEIKDSDAPPLKSRGFQSILELSISFFNSLEGRAFSKLTKEIDKPEDQEAARGNPFVNPSMETAVKSAKSKSDKVRQKVGRPMTGVERAIARAKGQQID